MTDIGKLFVQPFLVISLLILRCFFCHNCILFRSRSRPVFNGSGSGSEQTVSTAPAPAPAPTKMCRLRQLRLRLRLLLRIPAPNSFVDIPSFNLFRSDTNSPTAKHGVCCYVHQSIKVVNVSHSCPNLLSFQLPDQGRRHGFWTGGAACRYRKKVPWRKGPFFKWAYSYFYTIWCN